jgi:hypothetical protein
MSQTSFDPFGNTVPPRRIYAPPPPVSRPLWWLIPILVIFLAFCVLGLLFGYVLISSLNQAGSTAFGHTLSVSKNNIRWPGAKQTQSALVVADDFMQRLKNHKSLQAYNNFDTTVLGLLTPLDFERQARHADICYGSISHFHVVKHTEGSGIALVTYTVTRRKWSSPYCFQIALQQNSEGDWAITSYGKNGTLGPSGGLSCA